MANGEWRIAFLMWLFSRGVIAIAALGIAPLLSAPPGGVQPEIGWDIFFSWDSIEYERIVEQGYEYAPDGKAHNVAFFPLYPLAIAALMQLGFSSTIAGMLVNNLAFLATLLVLHEWVESRHGTTAARATSLFLAWCPLSLYGTVVYTEGLYLLLSTLTLRASDRAQNAGVAIWGTLATATRPTGLALIPALVLAAWFEKRPWRSYLAAVLASGGVLAYASFCWWKFGDPLAFVEAQKGWRETLGFDWVGWLKMFVQVVAGTQNWNVDSPFDPWHPLLFCLLVACGWGVWRNRDRWGTKATVGGFFVALGFWLLGGDPLTNLAMLLGGGALLWYLRRELRPVTLLYGACAIALLLASGGTISLNRLAYGIISLNIAFGLWLARLPRWQPAILALLAIVLITFTIRFAQGLWVA